MLIPEMISMNNRELFYQYLGQTSTMPLSLEIDRAQGLYMYAADDKEYMDLISGISVSNIGHCHPAIVDAIRQQSEKYLHLMVYGEFVQSPQVQLAQLLTTNLPATLDNVYLVNSGSEAIEGALKLAKRYTGRHEIIAFKNAYHGSSHGSLSVTGNEALKNAFRPLLPGIRFLEYNDPEQLYEISDKTACVLVETIQGEAGAVVPDVRFMKELRRQCDRNGALLIMDEIQAGCGRSGSLWAFDQMEIVPDILTLAKGLGGGMPLGAFISSREIMHVLTHDPVLGHINTFGGNALCAAAALANMKVITDNKLWKNARAMEKVFRRNLHHPAIKNIRGRGLLLALEFDDFEQNKLLIDKLIEKGLLTDWFLFAPQCLRIAPPLIITEKEVEKACRVITETLHEIYP